jgi:ADYC domain
MKPALLDPRRLLLVPAIFLATASVGCAERGAAPIGPGAVLSALDEQGATVTLRVEGVEADAKDAEGDVFLYQLSVRDAEGGWHPYCLPDREGRTVAIPLQGSWDATRTHQASDEITFACINGALGKCVRWGYKPWKTVNGVSLADYHQACVHMTGADYCGDGRSHTRDGTLIDLWDNLGIQKRDPALGLAFEAAWSPRGAVYLQKPRFGETLESLVAACPDRLRGRTALDVPGLDPEAVAARWPEALIFTESRVQSDLP